MKEENFPNSRKPSHRRVCGEFWNLRGQHNWEGEKKKIPQNMSLTATASRQVAQMLASITSEGDWTVRRGWHHWSLGYRLPVANHVFLGSCIVDICQEGHSLRSAPQRRHMAHLRRCFRGVPRKPSGWDCRGD